ncbi:MAG: enoyl-CoA hydratase/isomerase family protein [Methylobacteriaceae bacterium]|nr:enoyl-CoA hydratase/isomerase family protein [Methylobacteriaceae bacterium]MBV9244630.1 enoyl-CoA hydratase/isomerase family protein [Methylobacteriaceae bacterium]MBV9634423.1 enoyl-CoA hydratase/isomerase family protein [Methylobacteriaceae bacterium]MBV9702333.1 enoyl-CoA hydratase/isomerase family protein [Methylobacteriaceae bacterium]
MSHIGLKVAAGLAEITLARPEKLNAVTPQMATDIERISHEIDRDESVRAVLVTGAGDRAFSSGSDLGSLAAYPSAWQFRNRIEYATAFRNIRKPVIAALKGWVLGGGAEIALAADIRIADRTARIGFPEVTRGWVGGGGASQMLPRLIGYGQAMRLLLTGDPIDSAQALALGLVEEVVDPGHAEVRARELCLQLARFSPVAVQSVKAAVRAALSMPLDAGLRYENEMNALCFHAGDHREGIKAFQDKRPAEFSR